MLAQVAEEEPLPSTIIQKVFLGLLIIAVVVIFATRFIAKAVNIYDASFGKAFIATFLKNAASLGALFFMGLAPGVPHALTLLISLGILPIFVYKMVFSAETIQAVLIWLGVLVVEFALGVGLSSAGLFDLQGLLKI